MKANLIKPALAVAGILVTGLACKALFPEDSSTSEEANRPAPIFQDDFTDSTNWKLGTDSDAVSEYAEGGLRMKVSTTDYISWVDQDSTNYKDIHFEATVKDNSTDDSYTFGLLCDQQGHGKAAHYWFGLDPNGNYAIGKHVVGNDDAILTGNGDWAASDLITKHAASYRLGVDCGHGTLAFYVDGKKLDSVQDNTYSQGIVALFLWSADKPAGPVVFDDVVITPLK